MELEKKVLQGIMDFLDNEDGEQLKKHPKVMAMSIEKKPVAELEQEEIEKPELGKMSEEDMSPEMVKKLIDMYEKMKD